MYQICDRVVYGIHGVCQVVALEERTVDRKKVVYLALEPVGQGGSRYLIPTHNEAAMGKLRKMLNAEELKAMLSAEQIRRGEWIPDENRRKQTYREQIAGGDRMVLLEMICTIYRHKEMQIAAGKKVHLCDENFLRDAERLVAGELAIAMEISLPEALSLLREHLK